MRLVSLVPFLTTAAVCATLAGAVACSSDDTPSDGSTGGANDGGTAKAGAEAGAGGTGGDGGGLGGNTCTCDVSYNGVEQVLSCGTGACINDEQFSCSASGASDEGACPVGDDGGSDASTSNGDASVDDAGKTDAASGQDAGSGAEAGPAPTVGFTATLNGGETVTFTASTSSISAKVVSGEYDIDSTSPSDTTLKSFVLFLQKVTPGSYDCSDNGQSTNSGELTYTDGTSLTTIETNQLDPCSITITANDGSYIYGTVNSMSLADQNGGSASITGKFITQITN